MGLIRDILTNRTTTDADREAAANRVLADLGKAYRKGQTDAADRAVNVMVARAREAARVR